MHTVKVVSQIDTLRREGARCLLRQPAESDAQTKAFGKPAECNFLFLGGRAGAPHKQRFF